MVSVRIEVFTEKERKYVGGDKLKVLVKSASDDWVVEPALTDNGDGTYTVSFKHQPGKSGEFIISTFVDGEETKNSPYCFNYAE